MTVNQFLTVVVHDNFKLIHAHFNEWDKVRECYDCLKIMMQAPFTCCFFTVLFIKHASLKRFCLHMKLFHSSVIFKQKNKHKVSCDQSFSMNFFLIPNSENDS